MPQRGFVVEQNPLNIVTFRQFLRDLTAGIFAPLVLVTIKSLRGTLLFTTDFSGLSIMIHGWQMLANKWLTWENDHWCSRSGAHTKLDSRAWINISAPMLNNGEFDRCRK